MDDVFTRGVRGIRFRYAVVGVVFLVLMLGMFYLGGPVSFGVYTCLSILVLALMGLTIFLMQSHYILSPIERMTARLSEALAKAANGTETVRVQWNGTDEFAKLAAAINGVLETIQSRSMGAQEENRRLRDIVDGLETELVAMNRSGSVLNVIHCPEGMVPVPGLARGFKPDATVWGERNCAAFENALAAVFGKGGRQTVELAFKVGGDGRTRRIRASLTRSQGSAFPLVFFREEEPLTAPAPSGGSQVLANRTAIGIANDFRRVLTAVRDAAEACAGSADGAAGGPSEALLEAVREGFARVEEFEIMGGESHLKLKQLPAAGVLEKVRPRAEAEAGQSGVRVECDIPADLPDVLVDQEKIGTVFLHVVRNAVDAFGAIPGRISVSARPVALSADEAAAFTPPLSPGEGVRITVQDDGPGLSAAVCAHAFEPYCTTREGRRGLGLSVAAAIVAAHGGGMRISSVKGVSTEVEVFLPRAKLRSADPAALHRAFPGGEILAVDDNRSVLRMTAALLGTQGISTACADSRKDALRLFAEMHDRLRAVFLDAQIGESKSVGLLADMRAINPGVPVVVVTAYTASQVRAFFASCPPDAYLMKPYTIDELKQVLKSVL